MTDNYNIRTAVHADAEAIGIIGPAIYAESYGHMWDSVAALSAHLDTFRSSAVIKFMSRPDTSIWVLEDDRGVGGFLSLVLFSSDPLEERSDGAELPRIYLLAPFRGRGLAAELVSEAERYARASGANHLWLDAMKGAPWAWRAYRKLGFEQTGETSFTGQTKVEFKSMVVMRRPIVQ